MSKSSYSELIASLPPLSDEAEADYERRIERKQQPRTDKPTGRSLWPGTQSSADFIRSFPTPEYMLDGVLLHRNLYSFTGKTSSGKTSVTLRLAAHVALGRPFGPFNVHQGKVIYMAGENPMDVMMRWRALAKEMGFDPGTIPVHFVPGNFPIDKAMAEVVKRIDELGDVRLVVVDTAQAYFTGDNELDNVQQQAFGDALRRMLQAKSGPCVIVNCHPVKNAKDSDFPLLPRGAGGFVNTIDGNVNIHMVGRDPMLVTMRCTPKHRGPEFETLTLRLNLIDGPTVDSQGRMFRSVVAVPLSEAEEAAVAQEMAEDAQAFGRAMAKDDGASLGDLAKALGWKRRQAQSKMDYFTKRGWAEMGDDSRNHLTQAGRQRFAAVP